MYPALAIKTFERLKGAKVFAKIFNRLTSRLKTISSPVLRAKVVHKEIDYFVDEVLANPTAQANVKCKKGCSACCHTQVSITDDEAEVLATLVKEGHAIDRERLNLQALVSEQASMFYKLDYEDRKCVFLNSKGECSIYENRPSVCRSNLSLSEPSQCSTEDGIEKPQRLLLTEKADMVIIAAFATSKKTGSLPKLLKEKLKA